MKVFLYMRVSSEEQAKHGYSLDAQEQALMEFCQKNSHVIVGVYKDEGISGRKPYTKRPAMVELLHDLELVKPDIILFTKLDRWFRNIKEYYKVQDILDKNKVDWKAINEEYDTSTASGRLYVNIKLSIAQDEADRTSERIKDTHATRIAKGEILGGRPPFGYKFENKHLVFDENVGILKDAIEHYMTHQSTMRTAKYINEKYGLAFTHIRMKNMFQATTLKGEYRGNPNFCKPLITPKEWNRLQEILSRNIKYATTRTYLFSGLIKCPVCGKNLSACTTGSGKYYRCKDYGLGICDFTRHLREEKLEKWLLDFIEDDYKVKVTMKPKQKKEDPKKYKDRLKRLNEIYILGNISEDDYKRQSADLQKKIAEIQKKPSLKNKIFVSNWKDLYAELSEENRRSFWRSIIKEIVISVDNSVVEVLY